MVFDLTASSNSRKLMILNPEYPRDIVKTVTPGESDTAVFQVVIAEKGRPEKYTYQWYVNGETVEGAQSDTYERDLTNDKGEYTVWCEVTNKAGTVRTREAKLTVKKVPVLDTSYPADASAIIAKTAEFKVVIKEDGYPTEYTYQWYADGNAIEEATEAVYNRKAGKVGTENIHCVVTNEAGTVQSRTAVFTISKEDIVIDGDFVDGSAWGTYSNGGAGNIGYSSINGVRCFRIYVDGAYKGYAHSNNLYDFTGKNKLVFYVSAFDNQSRPNTNDIHFGVSDTAGEGNFIAHTTVVGHMGNYEKVVVDVSAVSGMHRIKFGMSRTTYNADLVYLEDVWFE